MDNERLQEIADRVANAVNVRIKTETEALRKQLREAVEDRERLAEEIRQLRRRLDHVDRLLQLKRVA